MARDHESEYQRHKAERDRFGARVRALEEYARREPDAYRRKVVLLAWMGYAVIAAILIAGLLLMGILVWLAATNRGGSALWKLIVLVGLFCFLLLRSLLMRWPQPEGVEAGQDECPALFDMVDELSKKLNAPRIHRILVTDDFNAFAAQWPRLGAFGWNVNILILGMPYMMSVSPDELRATVAHELGHFCGSHGRMGNRIYRLNSTWSQMLDTNAAGAGGIVLALFLRWYQPVFDAYTFAFRRANEYEADAAAVRVGSGWANATDLMRFRVQGRLVSQEFWKEVFAQIEEHPSPPKGTYTRLLEFLKRPLEREQVQQWLRAAFREPTGYDDTHPSLTDRLRAMGELPPLESESDWARLADSVAQIPSPTAAELFLGDGKESLVQRLEKSWRTAVREGWHRRHEHVKKNREIIERYLEADSRGELSDGHLLDLAEKVADLDGMEKAEPLYRRYLEKRPDDGQALYELGVHLLGEESPDATEFLEKAARADPSLRQAAFGLLYDLHERAGKVEQAESFYNEALREDAAVADALDRLGKATAKDVYEPPKLSPDQVKGLTEALAGRDDLSAAYLVRRTFETLPQRAFHLLVIDPKKPSIFTNRERLAERIGTWLREEVQAPRDTTFIVLTSQGWLRKKLEKLGWARIL